MFNKLLQFLPMIEAVPYFFICYLPSVIKIVRNKSSKDVSLMTWAASTTLYFLYIFYGIEIVKSWQYVLSTSLGFIGCSAILITAIRYKPRGTEYTAKELKELFSSVGWAQDITEKELYKAIKQSSHMVIHREKGKLVGLARSMDDGIYSANIDLVVVHHDYQGCGIAKRLIEDLKEQLHEIQYISVSPNESSNVFLYQKCGFTLVDDARLLQIINEHNDLT